MRIPIPEPPDNPPCFACGSKNPDGIHLQFFLEDNEVSTDFTAPRGWSGWGDILHGGFQSLLLDETCSWAFATLAKCRAFVTADLSISFKKPVRVQQKLCVRARIVEQDEKKAITEGEILDEGGDVLTTGRAVIRILPPERFEKIARQKAGEGDFRQV